MNAMNMVVMLGPAISIALLIMLELSPAFKYQVYKRCPSWLLSLLVMMAVSKFMTGWMGPGAAVFADIVLTVVIFFDHRKVIEEHDKMEAKKYGTLHKVN